MESETWLSHQIDRGRREASLAQVGAAAEALPLAAAPLVLPSPGERGAGERGADGCRPASQTDVDTRRPPPLRRRVTRLVQGFTYWSGAVACLPTRGRAAILMYHSVAPPEAARYIDSAWRISAQEFERQVSFLARHRRVISLRELVQRLKDGVDPEPGSVVLTFDDGYRDNLHVAAPILSRHGLPATLFLATAYVDHAENQWTDRLYTLFTTRRRHRCVVADRCYDLDRPREWSAAYHGIALQLLEASPAERLRRLRELERQLEPAARAPRLTLDWTEVRELVTKYPAFEIGVHTACHVDLAGCGAEQIRGELETCIADVARELGTRPLSFSFPYGRYSALACQLAAEGGLDCAMGPAGPWLVDSATDPYSLPRMDARMSATLLRWRTHPSVGSLPDVIVQRG